MNTIIMEKEFKEYGQKMPYEVPEGFFQDMEAQLLELASHTEPAPGGASDLKKERVVRVETIGPKLEWKRRAWHWGMAGGIAAALVMALLLWNGKMERKDAAEMEYLYSYNNEMTDYEMIEIAEMIGNDIFLSLDME